MRASFGGRDNNLDSFKRAKSVVIPVPYGRTVTYRRGTEKGPAAILDASSNMELFDEELNEEIYRIGIKTQAPLRVNNLKPEKMINAVRQRVSDIFKHNKLPVVLGGEHSVTIGAVRAAKRQCEDLSILYFDAHCDLKNRYDGSGYNHACVARRLLEMAPVVEVGLRSLSKEESDFASDKNIKIIKMVDMTKDADWCNSIERDLSKNIYISIDLDVFDPSVMPSVGNPEPGGMFWFEFLKAIRNIIAGKEVIGFDIVELCPIKDMVAPDYMAAKLVYKILGYIFR